MINTESDAIVGQYIKSHVDELWQPFFKDLKEIAEDSLDDDNVEDNYASGQIFTFLRQNIKPDKSDQYYIKKLTKYLLKLKDRRISGELYLHDLSGDKYSFNLEVIYLNSDHAQYIAV